MDSEKYDPKKGRNCLPECAYFVQRLSSEYGIKKPFEDSTGSKENELIYLLDSAGKRLEALKLLHKISNKVLSGELFRNVLKYTFEALRDIIPYDRVSITFIGNLEKNIQLELRESEIPIYCLELEKLNSIDDDVLAKVLTSKKPVICRDRKINKPAHDDFESARISDDMGMRSTITSPLISDEQIIAIIMFSSLEPSTYQLIHNELLKDISEELSLIVKHQKLKLKMINNSGKSQQMSMMCHDLKSPLSIVKGYVDILSEDFERSDVKREDKEFLKIITRSIQSMFDVIAQAEMYDYTERASLFLKKKDVNIHSFLEEMVLFFKIPLESKRIQIELKEDFSLPEYLIFDPICIKQILDNLINNAIKFSLPETTITLKACVDNSNLFFSVSDQGLGIRSDEIKSLFKPFSKLSTRPTGNESSTGLGLAIVDRLVKVHGGTIKVDSEIEKGTTFVFSIPLEKTL